MAKRAKKQAKKQKAQRGGYRPNSGRNPELDDPLRRVFTLEARHLPKLDRYVKRYELSGRSAAIRDLIDEYA